jgi:hypothetical protein
MSKIKNRKIVIVNQAVNYLTIGFANAFYDKFEDVTLITGSIHSQGEELNPNIKVKYINKWHESPARKKVFSYIKALFNMWFLLLFKFPKHEVFFVSVPPMGYLLNLLLPHRFSMVIWDVYPDAFKIVGVKESSLFYRVWAKMNIRSFKKSFRLFTISERMAELLTKYVNRQKIIIQPIWSIFQENIRSTKKMNPFIQKHSLENKFVVQYSGNIGLSHNVETLIDLAEIMIDCKDIIFQIIGRGPRKLFLEQLVKDKNLPNTMFLPFQSDDMFPFSLSAADVGVVILDDITSKGSVPSKSFNLMSYGIPSLYIASDDSQLNVYAKKYKHAVCCNKDQLVVARDYILELKNNPTYFSEISHNAQNASNDFKRVNADKFVNLYLE